MVRRGGAAPVRVIPDLSWRSIMTRKSQSSPPLLTVLYDGASEHWRTRIGLYKLEARQLGLDIAWRDLARDPEAAEDFGIDPSSRESLHAVDGDGEVFSGEEALALLWSALPSHRRLGHALAMPTVSALARLCARAARLATPRRPAPAAGRASR
jgi:hypothetical protein